jgi:hypothetical protein
MTTRFEFGYGDGDIYRRRMEAQEEMFRQVAREQDELPEEDQERLNYASDYYGFRGAGRRTTTAESDQPTRAARGRQHSRRRRR